MLKHALEGVKQFNYLGGCYNITMDASFIMKFGRWATQTSYRIAIFA
jgi:hypothetical protein